MKKIVSTFYFLKIDINVLEFYFIYLFVCYLKNLKKLRLCLVRLFNYDLRIWIVFWICVFWNYALNVKNLFDYNFWIEYWIEHRIKWYSTHVCSVQLGSRWEVLVMLWSCCNRSFTKSVCVLRGSRGGVFWWLFLALLEVAGCVQLLLRRYLKMS